MREIYKPIISCIKNTTEINVSTEVFTLSSEFIDEYIMEEVSISVGWTIHFYIYNDKGIYQYLKIPKT